MKIQFGESAAAFILAAVMILVAAGNAAVGHCQEPLGGYQATKPYTDDYPPPPPPPSPPPCPDEPEPAISVCAVDSALGQRQLGLEVSRSNSSATANIAGAQINRGLGMNPSAAQGTQVTGIRSQPLKVTGLAAGGAPGNLGLWIAPVVSQLENELSASAYDGDSYSVLAGLDYKLGGKFVIGVALGYEASNLDTTYNDGTFDSTGYTIAPYLGWAIGDNISVDAIFGYTMLENDVERNKSTDTVTASFDSARTLFSANLNYFPMLGQWNISASVGYMYTEEDQDAYTENGGAGASSLVDSNVYVGEIRAGAHIGYFYRKVEPYISAYYLYDSTWNSDAEDRDEVEGTVGLNYYPNQNWTCGLEATNSFLRDDFSNTRVLLNLRYNW